MVLSRSGYAPHEARSLVFIVRSAHELSQQAANALLKTLEEPAAHVHFVLLTHQPNRLLDTIRSRTLAVRFGPLPEEVVASILASHGKPRELARLAGGSARAALSLADEDVAKARADFVESALDAARAPALDAALAFAGARPDDRDELRENLLQLSRRFALEARDTIATEPDVAELAARRYTAVLETMTSLERNAQPALALETLMIRLRA